MTLNPPHLILFMRKSQKASTSSAFMYSTLQKLIKPAKKAYPVLPLLLLWILSTIKKKTENSCNFHHFAISVTPMHYVLLSQFVIVIPLWNTFSIFNKPCRSFVIKKNSQFVIMLYHTDLKINKAVAISNNSISHTLYILKNMNGKRTVVHNQRLWSHQARN